MASEYEGDAHDLRIVLLGVSGAGKSSMGNAILDREVVTESRTRESEIQSERVEDRNISIIDTPGFFNNQLTDEEMKKQMIKSLELSDPGPHVFLLIVNLENFEEDERNIVEEIKEIFGAQALMFTMVLFIGRERMSNKEWNDCKLSGKFKGLVSNFSGQYHEINSTNEINQTHIKKLLKKIDEFIEQNDGQHYNNKIYSVSQTGSTKEERKQQEEKKYIKKEQERERQEQALQDTFEMNTAMKEGAAHAVFEPENVQQRKKTTDEETTLQGINLLDGGMGMEEDKSWKMSQKKQQTTEEKNPTQAGRSRCFEMKGAMDEGATHGVFEPENVRQRKKTTDEETKLEGINSLDRDLTFLSQEKQQTKEEKHPAKAGVATAPLLHTLLLQLDLYPGVARIKDKLKKQCRGSRCLVLTTVCLGIICVLLLVTIILQNNTIRAQRDQLKSYENTVEELTQTINSLQDNFTDVTTEKDLCHQLTKRIVMSDLRIMMVGKTGAGKSASGNTILGGNVFEEKMSSESVTKTCQQHQQKVKGGRISVIDTPGLFDTKDSKKQLKGEIEKCVNMSVPGPHAFLLVIRLDVRFTDEEKKTVKWIQDNFGEKAADHSIILFTRGDQIDKPIEEFLKGNRQIEELVRQCKSRYHVFNNKDKNPSQVNELLDKIVSMVMENGGKYYTNEMYKEALKKQKEEDERRKLEEEENKYKEALKRQREEDERWRLKEEENKYKEALKKQKEEDERWRLEEGRKMEERFKKINEDNNASFMNVVVVFFVAVVVGVILIINRGG